MSALSTAETLYLFVLIAWVVGWTIADKGTVPLLSSIVLAFYSLLLVLKTARAMD